MSENIIVDLVSDLNLLIDGLEGFTELISDDTPANCAILLFLSKVQSDLDNCRQSVFELSRRGYLRGAGASGESTGCANTRDEVTD